MGEHTRFVRTVAAIVVALVAVALIASLRGAWP